MGNYMKQIKYIGSNGSNPDGVILNNASDVLEYIKRKDAGEGILIPQTIFQKVYSLIELLNIRVNNPMQYISSIYATHLFDNNHNVKLMLDNYEAGAKMIITVKENSIAYEVLEASDEYSYRSEKSSAIFSCLDSMALRHVCKAIRTHIIYTKRKRILPCEDIYSIVCFYIENSAREDVHRILMSCKPNSQLEKHVDVDIFYKWFKRLSLRGHEDLRREISCKRDYCFSVLGLVSTQFWLEYQCNSITDPDFVKEEFWESIDTSFWVDVSEAGDFFGLKDCIDYSKIQKNMVAENAFYIINNNGIDYYFK